MSTELLEQTDTNTTTRYAPKYSLLLLNDEEHSFNYVIDLLMRVFHMEEAKAKQVTQHIHEQGEAIVYTNALEYVELKQEQVNTFGDDIVATLMHKRNIDFPLGTRIEEV